MILAGGVDSAPPRGSQGMKGPWAIGLNIIYYLKESLYLKRKSKY